tara:strand:+ start:236 stop:1315 length:1080 start_codon:yes stop_codon:yes gene_type:complete
MEMFDALAMGLGGFGAGVQGNGTQYLQQLRESEQTAQLKQLGSDLATGVIDETQYLKSIAQYAPDSFLKFKLARAGQNMPSVLQVADAMYKARNEGNTQYLNDINAAGKTIPKGAVYDENGQIVGQGGYNSTMGEQARVIKAAETQADQLMKNMYEPDRAGNVEQSKILAKTQADAKSAYSSNVLRAEKTKGLIDQLVGSPEKGTEEHAGLKAAVGGVDTLFPSVMNDTKAFENILDEVKGGAFLQSIQALQGYGALSNNEGAAATQAYTRMTTATSEADFRAAARETQQYIDSGLQKAKALAEGDFGMQDSGNGYPITTDMGDEQVIMPNAVNQEFNSLKTQFDSKKPKIFNAEDYFK